MKRDKEVAGSDPWSFHSSYARFVHLQLDVVGSLTLYAGNHHEYISSCLVDGWIVVEPGTLSPITNSKAFITLARIGVGPSPWLYGYHSCHCPVPSARRPARPYVPWIYFPRKDSVPSPSRRCNNELSIYLHGSSDRRRRLGGECSTPGDNIMYKKRKKTGKNYTSNCATPRCHRFSSGHSTEVRMKCVKLHLKNGWWSVSRCCYSFKGWECYGNKVCRMFVWWRLTRGGSTRTNVVGLWPPSLNLFARIKAVDKEPLAGVDLLQPPPPPCCVVVKWILISAILSLKFWNVSSWFVSFQLLFRHNPRPAS